MKNNNNSPLTVYDIAHMAGVSPATVSKVINRRRGVNAETAANVVRILRETGFSPRWKAGTCKVVGFIGPAYPGIILDSYDSQILSQCCDELMEKGFSLQLVNPCHAADMKSFRSFLSRSEMISGVIIIANPINYEFCREMLRNSSNFPCVVIGKLDDSTANSIPEAGNHLWTDDYAAGYQLATLFLRHNHRKFHIVSATLDDVGHRHRTSGIIAALKSQGIPPENITTGEVKEDLRNSGAQLAMIIACKKVKPDAIIFTNGAICAGFVTGCVNMKVRIPEEISVAGFEDASELEYLPVPVTSMHTPARQLGEAAVKALLAQIDHTLLPFPKVLQHSLCIRNTISMLQD